MTAQISLFLSILTFTPFAQASSSVQTFTVGEEKQKITASIPAKWQTLNDKNDGSLSIISPKGLQERSTVIQIVPSAEKDNNDEIANMKKDADEYYSQKDDDADELGGSVLSYLPVTESKKDGATITSVGVKLENLAGQFINRSYYITTKSKEFFYVNALIPVDFEDSHEQLISEVVESVSSKN